jgi:hypothetical protein
MSNMRALQEQWKGLNALCGHLELAGLPHGEISTKHGERFLLHLPVSRGREVIYAIDGYDIWKRHLLAADLSVEAVIDYLKGKQHEVQPERLH